MNTNAPALAGLLYLVASAPLLVFPDLVPTGWRTSTVSLLGFAAIALALRFVNAPPRLVRGLWVFAAAVSLSWVLTTGHDLPGLRHFAGIAAGLLTMVVVAMWCTTPRRLFAFVGLLSIGALCVLGLGLIGAYLTRTKVIIGTTQPIQAPSVVCCPDYLYPWLPHVELGLPGLENGSVNPNALAGTALMLLPICAGLAAAWRQSPRAPRTMLVAGVAAAAFASAVLVMAQSRTALLAAVITFGVLALRWRRGRWWLVASLSVALLGAGYGAYSRRATSGDIYQLGTELAKASLSARFDIWDMAASRLRERPLVGIGISQFHPQRSEPGTPPVAHAHNFFLQSALDVGLIGLAAYLWFVGELLVLGNRAARGTGPGRRLAAGAALSLVAVHLFGLGDAITLGAKVGLFQWIACGLILAIAAMPQAREPRVIAPPAPLPT